MFMCLIFKSVYLLGAWVNVRILVVVITSWQIILNLEQNDYAAIQ